MTHQTKHCSPLLSNFGEPVKNVASVFSSYMTGVAPSAVVCCSSASGFDVLSAQRRSAAYFSGVPSGYLRYCWLSVIANQSSHFSLISGINKEFLHREKS